MIATPLSQGERSPLMLDGLVQRPQAQSKAPPRPIALAFLPDAPLVEISHLLDLAQSGDQAARDELLGVLYDELHGIARRHMRGQPQDHTLQATALVNEAWMRMSPARDLGTQANDEEARPSKWNDRQHFLALASRAMRCVLVDHARKQNAQKRQEPGERMALDRVLVVYENRAMDLDSLDKALTELEAFDPEMAQVIELRFFGGLDMQSIADQLELPKRTLERRWLAARSWLKARIQ